MMRRALSASIAGVCVLTALGLMACGTQDKKSTDAATTTTTTTLSFTTDINPILTTSCGTSSCHGAGSPFGVYVDGETAFKKSSSKARLDAGTMPQTGSTQAKSFTADNKSKILKFLAQ